MTENKKCVHEWVYEPSILLTNPPQNRKICRKCGMKITETEKSYPENDYYEIVKKFEVKNANNPK